ncbi:MAG: TerB family tellurite resistance protein [Candidatus Poseidoniales archaeon]|nr:TerB family tellurite resistance protein [Candidatus Poseidoniales archaeon]
MVSGFLGTLTTEERTLLHLLDHQLPENNWEAPMELTQAGISAAVHVQRKHVPRTLKRLEQQSFLNTTSRHVPGARQRRRVYSLTLGGRERAQSILNRIKSTPVNSGGTTVLLQTLLTSSQDTLETLAHIDEHMVVHSDPVMSPVSHPEGSASLDAQAGEALIRRMFARAWQDGRITKDEQLLLNEVVDFLGMHPERVRRLSNEARREIDAPPPEEIYLDMLRQALVDGVIHEEEDALLKTVQIAFDIDADAHERILKIALQQPYITPEIEAYRSVLRTALIDGIITSDESAMLETLRKTTGITNQEHAMLLAELQDGIEG